MILKALLSFLVIQLNIYFAWTSRVGIMKSHHETLLRSFLVGEVSGFTRFQFSIFPDIYSYFMGLAYNSNRSFAENYTLGMKYLIDCEVITFTVALFIISLLLFKRRNGIDVSILRAFEITSATILPLGFEIYYFDRSQFWIHASDIQVRARFLPWFTNADLLYLASGIFATTLLIELSHHLLSQRRRNLMPVLRYIPR